MAASTPRDVLKTLIQGYIQHQVAEHQSLSPRQRETLRDELTDEQALEHEVDELLKTDASPQREVPIQAGFGIGAPPSLDQN
ncbi:MAG: hypothetical protein ABIJ09_02285 [Pseudomonadota bacterium]